VTRGDNGDDIGEGDNSGSNYDRGFMVMMIKVGILKVLMMFTMVLVTIVMMLTLKWLS
jgi:hypothetical protein